MKLCDIPFCILLYWVLYHTHIFARQVLTSTRWFTVEDWLESCQPLCPVLVRHQPRPECAPEPAALILAPCAPHIGEGVLAEGFSPQCRLLAAQPETLAVLLFVEALEDNETLLLEGASQSARINPLPPHYEPLTAVSNNGLLYAMRYFDFPLLRLIISKM
jgi:hypothetical protein